MKIKNKAIEFRNSVIDSILNRLEKTKTLPEREDDGYVDISSLSDEDRQNAFKTFSEGNIGLYNLLENAYKNGIESVFSCAGHSDSDNGYVVFKVTDENLEKLRTLGKVLSHEGIATNFQTHYKFGNIVSFHAFKACNKDWFSTASDTILNPPTSEVIPEIYYHENFVYSSNTSLPLSYRIKSSLVDKLRKIRFGEVENGVSSPNTQDFQTFSSTLKKQYPVNIDNSSPKEPLSPAKDNKEDLEIDEGK